LLEPKETLMMTFAELSNNGIYLRLTAGWIVFRCGFQRGGIKEKQASLCMLGLSPEKS
jgi:hypothetical protein